MRKIFYLLFLGGGLAICAFGLRGCYYAGASLHWPVTEGIVTESRISRSRGGPRCVTGTRSTAASTTVIASTSVVSIYPAITTTRSILPPVTPSVAPSRYTTILAIRNSPFCNPASAAKRYSPSSSAVPSRPSHYSAFTSTTGADPGTEQSIENDIRPSFRVVLTAAANNSQRLGINPFG